MRWSRAHTRNLIILLVLAYELPKKVPKTGEQQRKLVRNGLRNSDEEARRGDNGKPALCSSLCSYIFQHNISKFYYCYDYVPSVERYIFQSFIYVRFFLFRLSAACFSFLLLPTLAGFTFCIGKSWNINFPENKCSCSQDSRAQCHSLTSASPLMCCHAITDSKMEWPRVIR